MNVSILKSVFVLVVFTARCHSSGLVRDSGLSGDEQLTEYFKQNELLEYKVKLLEEKIADLEEALKKDEARDDMIESKIKELKNTNAFTKENNWHKLHRRQSSLDTSVAFSASLDHDQNLGQDQVIRFSHVILNEGNGYNTRTGAFTAPVDGVYFLSFFIGQHSVNEVLVKLVVNDVAKVHATAETVTNTDDSQGGNVVLLKLSKGDVVKVEHAIRGSHVEGSKSTRLSTFSGFLLYSTEYAPPNIIGK